MRLSRRTYIWALPGFSPLLISMACTEAEYALDQAAPLMDDAIREDIHSNFAAASDAAEFLAEYERRHEAKYAEEFRI